MRRSLLVRGLPPERAELYFRGCHGVQRGRFAPQRRRGGTRKAEGLNKAESMARNCQTKLTLLSKVFSCRQPGFPPYGCSHIHTHLPTYLPTYPFVTYLYEYVPYIRTYVHAYIYTHTYLLTYILSRITISHTLHALHTLHTLHRYAVYNPPPKQ